MHYRVARWLQPLMLAAVAVLFSPVIAAAPLSFQATINFSEQVIPTDTGTPCFAMGTITGSGSATKLGGITVTSTDCINPLPPAFTSFGFASHNVVLTASNGDHLWATYAGILSAEGRITGFVRHIWRHGTLRARRRHRGAQRLRGDRSDDGRRERPDHAAGRARVLSFSSAPRSTASKRLAYHSV